MKIYRRDEFMKLPAGTIFCKCSRPWAFEDLCVKGDTWQNTAGENYEWIFTSIRDIDARDSGDACDRFDEMLEKGVSYPMHDTYGRDGCFDPNDVFLVYEVEDLKRLHAMICTAVTVA